MYKIAAFLTVLISTLRIATNMPAAPSYEARLVVRLTLVKVAFNRPQMLEDGSFERLERKMLRSLGMFEAHSRREVALASFSPFGLTRKLFGGLSAR